MKKHNYSKRKTVFSTSILIGAVMVSGLYLYHNSFTREYHSAIKKNVEGDKDGDKGALGMMQFFFNARKNIATGQMDYQAMAAANIAANNMMSGNATARSLNTLALQWYPLGPTNVGGRTRGILIDTINDPTHNTLFACGVSGGIWKSINAGATWDSVPGNDQLSSMEASCIAEDKNGVIYVGTGEGFGLFSFGDGFSTAMIGGGMFKSTDKGQSFTVIASTVPGTLFDPSAAWSYINRIAVDPTNPSYIYAATNSGLYGSNNGGSTWTWLKTGASNLKGNTLDVKISPDDKILVAATGVGGNPESAYYGYPNGSYLTSLTEFPATGSGKLPINGSRIEIAISPSNSNYVYVSFIGSSGAFGLGASTGTGVYMNMTALSSGGHWYDIGPGGSATFDPYSSDGSQEQATYDNTLAVFPNQPGEILLGGTTLFSWQQTNATDTIGNWTSITYYNGFVGGDPLYIHPDEHAIVFDRNNPNHNVTVVYDGNDGGIYKSINGGQTWAPMNRGYDVTQFVDVEFEPNVTTPPAGFTVGEGVCGGTQDNGNPFISGLQYYYQDANDLLGGDGGRDAISQLDPEIYYVTADFNSLFVGSSLSTQGQVGNAYTKIYGASKGANVDSMSQLGGCFYNQIALYENSYDTTTLDSMTWVADKTYTAGTTVYPNSPNSGYIFPYKLPVPVVKNDTLRIKDPVISKLAVAFNASNGVWLTMQAIDLSTTTIWMPIGGPCSKPDKFVGSDPVHTLAWSPNGDALFVGTEGGQLFRFSNLDSIIDSSYTSGATYGVTPGSNTVDTNYRCKVISTSLTAALGQAGRDILSISVDPENGNNVLVTLGNYGPAAPYVFYSSTALSATPSFTACQGNLPAMPVYSSLLHVLDKTLLAYPNSAMVGTERGVYITNDINNASPTWSYSSGVPNTLVMAMKQQTRLPWQCNNCYDVYVGTHGRGLYVSNSLYEPLGVVPVADATANAADFKVYPNPMTTQGTLEFNLPQATDVAITIYDITGKVVKSIPMANQAQGQHLVPINTDGFSVGTYIATVSGNGFLKSARFVVVR